MGAGSFDCTLDVPAHRYVVRVQAEGYLPEESKWFAGDGTPQAFTFRLNEGASRSAASCGIPMGRRPRMGSCTSFRPTMSSRS